MHNNKVVPFMKLNRGLFKSCYESDWSLSSLYPTSPNDFVSTNDEAAA